MGGCRCYFRQCHVSNAKFPRMHFFRFPLKESERYEKWRQYSKMEHMLTFSEVRRKNTSICARHFRTECFMNYKMDRLVPNAIPTLMRLSKDKALDFELDIENGVLVTLEETKFKHLIPPDDFECPLFLTNDKMLMEKLNELQSHVDVVYIDLAKSTEYEEVGVKEPKKTLINSVEILEAIQVPAPNSKRRRNVDDQDRPISSACLGNKKFRILNSGAGNNIKNGTSITLASTSNQVDNCIVNNEEIDYVETDQIQNTYETVNSEQFFLTSEVFINGDSEEAEDIEFFEIHKDRDTLHYEIPSNDSDATIVQLKNDEENNSTLEEINPELLEMRKQVDEFKKKIQNLGSLQVKLSLLEAENVELKKACEKNEEMSKKLLSLQLENISIKKALKGHETLKDNFHKFCEENKKLKEDVANINMLKDELMSKTQETKKLKKLLEAFKNSQSEKQGLIEKHNMDIENERSIYFSKEKTLNEELSSYKIKLALTQKQLKDRESELQKVKASLNNMKNENDNFCQRQKELEQSLNSTQNNFDMKQNEWKAQKSDYDNLQQKYSILEQKYWKLQALHNQEATVSTSLGNANTKINFVEGGSVSVNSLTKAQLFNGIKRYLSSSMVSLLRMEMFGSSEREWKSDERQISVDILRLGEAVYKYFCDEWRFRLPALRDVRNWLNQSQQVLDTEEDL